MKINLTLPVYNEEKNLERSVKSVLGILKKSRYSFEVIIADNASTDRTKGIAERLAKRYDKILYLRLEQKGRGLALKKAWSSSKADIVSYMDIDLSTSLDAYPALIEACKSYDFATGSRHLQSSKVDRRLKRAFLSRMYNFLVRLFLRSKIKDHQCGFKAAKKASFMKILPLLKNNTWFFDTEMLVLAQRHGMTIKEIPVEWFEDRMRESKVDILQTIREYLLNIFKMIRQ